MSENKKTNNSDVETTNNCPIPPIPKDTTDFLTLQYILEQVEKIQKELLDLKNTVNNIGCVTDCDRDSEEESTKTNQQIAEKKISAITEVFHHREESLTKLLSLYEKMYDDIINPNSRKLSVLEKLAEFGSGDAGAVSEKGFILENIKDLVENN